MNDDIYHRILLLSLLFFDYLKSQNSFIVKFVCF